MHNVFKVRKVYGELSNSKRRKGLCRRPNLLPFRKIFTTTPAPCKAAKFLENEVCTMTVKSHAGFSMNYLFPEYVCPQCGKHFVLPNGTDLINYTYKLRDANRMVGYCCSYHCYRAAIKAGEAKQAERKEARRKKMKEVFVKSATQYRERKAAQA